MTDAQFAVVLREWWSFSPTQQPLASWHDREDFIERRLPKLLKQIRDEAANRSLSE